MLRLPTVGTIGFVLAACLLVAHAPARADDTDDLLARIRKVGRGGAGNADAARAWKALVAQGNPALVPILSAMHDDEPTAANWLRPAFEAIAEKALAADKLSARTLEQFIGDRKKAGIARRLAYEWLVKLDKTAPDRLMPGMLLDPSAELRREAVERVIDQGKTALASKDEKAARDAFQKALSGACDPDQVDLLAKNLEKLGVKVDLQKHLGFVSQWHLITPFDHARGIGWDVAYPPEKKIDLAGTYKGKGGDEARWIAHATTDPHGLVDLKKTLGALKGTVAYACAFVDSPKEQLVDFRAGCINGLKIFLNGQEIFSREEYHHGMRVDQYVARGTLKKGRNVILLKVCQNEQTEKWAQDWKFQLRLCDAVGAAIPFTAAKGPAKEEK